MDNVALSLLLLAVLGAGCSFGLLAVLTLRAVRDQVERWAQRRAIRRRLQLIQEGRL